MNVLVINGHPRNDSFSEALVNAYLDGATRAGVNVTNLKLADLSFNLNVTEASPATSILKKISCMHRN